MHLTQKKKLTPGNYIPLWLTMRELYPQILGFTHFFLYNMKAKAPSPNSLKKALNGKNNEPLSYFPFKKVPS